MSDYYITGDTHGKFANIEYFCRRMKTTKDDLMIILGDVGLNFYLNKTDTKAKKFVEEIPMTFLCIHGNHEERPENISSYKTKEWNGGIVYYEEEFPSILFAKDGEIYNINGKKCIALGGAYSVDKEYRLLRGWTYFESEIPSKESMDHSEQQLDSVNWKVDTVLSHTVPVKYEPTEWFLPMVDQSKVDKTVELWLDRIEERLDYKEWYAGHYHGEKKIDKLEIMFSNIHKF